MMTNLFSIFDPSIYFCSSAWLMVIFPMTLFMKQTMKTSKVEIIFKSITKTLNQEIKSMMSNSKNSSKMIMISIFFFLAIINLVSLLPFNFTITSQISFNFPMALTMWLSFLLLGWMKQSKHMLSHLLPLGTPNALMPIMILIELTSQIIRPITLSVRLTANMVAGHLLLSLLGSLSISSKSMFIISLPASMALTFLEICVPIIQAYVFMTLVTLYSTEIN